MPNLTVPAAALGLPAPQPDLGAIMRHAHRLAGSMPVRISYADRLALALRRIWTLVRAEIARAFKRAAAAHVERLIAFMDALDGDADLEPDLAGEPNCGAPCDAEADDSDLEPSGDESEPSLGSLGSTAPTRHVQWDDVRQTNWAGGSRSDLEGDPNEDDEDGHDREASDLAGDGYGGNIEGDFADLEPSLGWPEAGEGAQGMNLGGCDDREEDVPSGFRRVQRTLAEERRAMNAAVDATRRSIDRILVRERISNVGELRPLASVTTPAGRTIHVVQADG